MKFKTRNLNAYFFFLVMLSILFCCSPKLYWQKPNSTEDDFNRDKYECMREAQQPNSSSVINLYGGYANSGMHTNMELATTCMRARGWRLEPAPKK